MSQASTHQNTSPPAHLVPARVTNTPPQTNQAPKNTRGAREEAQRGTCRLGTLCLSAPFGKPRLMAESLQNALSSQQYLMARRHAFALIRLSQKWRNNFSQLALTRAYKIHASPINGHVSKQADPLISLATYTLMETALSLTLLPPSMRSQLLWRALGSTFAHRCRRQWHLMLGLEPARCAQFCQPKLHGHARKPSTGEGACHQASTIWRGASPSAFPQGTIELLRVLFSGKRAAAATSLLS